MNEYRIDCSLIPDAQVFHRILAQTLPFPDWYGHNLDALFDCLTELEEPVRLILENWDETLPFSEGFQDAFLDAQTENPDFTVDFC